MGPPSFSHPKPLAAKPIFSSRTRRVFSSKGRALQSSWPLSSSSQCPSSPCVCRPLDWRFSVEFSNEPSGRGFSGDARSPGEATECPDGQSTVVCLSSPLPAKNHFHASRVSTQSNLFPSPSRPPTEGVFASRPRDSEAGMRWELYGDKRRGRL